MKKNIVLLAVFALVFALAPTAQAVILSDGHTGDYRIIFTTDGTFGAKDTTIGPYNNFVSGQAAADANLSLLGATWTTVGSTSLTDTARVNTGTIGTGADIHIYTPTTTAGTYQRVAMSYDDLWDGSIESIIQFGDGSMLPATQFPDTSNLNPAQTWAGSNSNGTAYTGGGGGVGYLGSSLGGSGASAFNIALARGGYTNGGWIFGADGHDGEADNGSTYEEHFMGMSGVLSAAPATGTPEPSAAILAALGFVGLIGTRRRRNRG